jgi:hypothetical protein
MLVHTSVLNSAHRSAAAAISRFAESIREQLDSGDAELLRQMAIQWDLEQDRVLAEQFDRARVSFDAFHHRLADVARSIEVKVENWSSTSRIDYSTPGRRYLVIGGNVLARGLTLEGLSVSFFLRSSSQYDTLMQMGRWFGYRPGYEDFPRVWMEDSVQQHFFDLAAIEAEIRRDIKRYAAEEITPQEFAVRIRRIPGMAITAPAKMRSAQTVQIGYAGSHLQTTRFFRTNDDWLKDNWAAGAQLVAAGNAGERGPNQVITDVSAANVRAFWSSYGVHSSHRPLAPQFLLDYLGRENGAGRLLSWNVVVIGADGGRPSGNVLGRLGHVQTVRRSALKGGGDEACVKALMSRRDLLVDFNGDPEALPDTWDAYKAARESLGQPPLVLLYPIEKESTPKPGTDTRVALDAARDVLGMAVVFPGLHATAQIYVSAPLAPDDAVETPEGDDSLPDDVVDAASAQN